MIVKILGFLDIVSGLAVLLYHFDLVAGRLLISVILYHIGKYIIFSDDPSTITDLILTLYIITMFLDSFLIPTVIASLYLFQRGVVSMLA